MLLTFDISWFIPSGTEGRGGLCYHDSFFISFLSYIFSVSCFVFCFPFSYLHSFFVCVRHGRKSDDRISHDAAQVIDTRGVDNYFY